MARIHVNSFTSPALRQQLKDLTAAHLSLLTARILEDDVDLEAIELVKDYTDDWLEWRQVPTGRKTLSISFWEKGAR